MRANIVGPPRSATRIRASIAACPCAAVWTFFGSPMMYLPASRRTQHAAAGQDDRVVELGGPIANDGRPTCGIVRRSYHRSRRRSQQLDRRRAERDGRVHDPDGGPHWPSAPILLGGWRSYQPRKRANRKRLLSATRRSRRAWPIFPGWRSRIQKDHSDTLGPTVVGATCSGFSSVSAVSFVPLQLSLAPMRVFAQRIEFALTCRLSAFMTPIRANIVGSPFSATSNSASTALCHSGAFFSFGLSAEM
jgi:hypothetical protein